MFIHLLHLVFFVCILSYSFINSSHYNLFYSCQIPLALLNGRVSEKSFKLWSGPVLLPLIALMLSKFSLIVPLVCAPWYFYLTVLHYDAPQYFCLHSNSYIFIKPSLNILIVLEYRAGHPVSATASTSLYHKLFWWSEVWYVIHFFTQNHWIWMYTASLCSFSSYLLYWVFKQC